MNRDDGLSSEGAGAERTDRRVAEEIAQEIADHLSEATKAARVSCPDGDEAERRAKERFGDAVGVANQCWWIQKGGDVMLRITAVTAAVLAACGVCLLGASAWRSQQAMARDMQAISSQLAEAQERQLAAFEKIGELLTRPGAKGDGATATNEAASPTGEVTGKIYLGDPERPAIGAEVLVLELTSARIVRRVTTDEQGAYAFRDLRTGDYFVLAGMKRDANDFIGGKFDRFGSEYYGPMAMTQSAPLAVRAGQTSVVDLDVERRLGRLAMSTSVALPDHVGEGKRRFDLFLDVTMSISGEALKTVPWSPVYSPPDHWPLDGYIHPHRLSKEARGASGSLSNFRNSIWWDEDLLFKTEGMETWADSYRLSAYLFATDIEIGEMLRKGGIPNAWFSQSPGRSYYSVQSYMNLASFGETSIRSIPVKGSPRGVLIASVRPNQVTRVQLVIPKDYESRLAAALAREPLDVNELSLLMSPQPLEIKLIGTEPIESMP